MPDTANWTPFTEEKTSGWTATAENGVAMEVWASIDEPNQFRVSVNEVLQPDFYPNREAAWAAAEQLAVNAADQQDTPAEHLGFPPEISKEFDPGGF